MKRQSKNKKGLYAIYWDVNNCLGWEMLQKFPIFF